MFHLGSGAMLPRASIVGIFDLDTATVSKHTRDFLRRAQDNDKIVTVGDDLPQTFIVTSENIYLSPQSGANLSKKLLTNP